MKKPPTKRERDQSLDEHHRQQFIKSVERVQTRLRALDCALAESKLYADLIAPKKGGLRK